MPDWLIEKTPVATLYESGPVAEIDEEASKPSDEVAVSVYPAAEFPTRILP